MSTVDWSVPREVDDITIAFPANVVGTLLPPMDVIPKPFKDISHPLQRAAETWFYRGVDLKRSTAQPRDGIDKTAAFRQLKACLGSYEPKHEHKMAGVAYLLSLFFAEVDFVPPGEAT
tara:strand:+ start:4059 stop:4412 length:354 start_codon:yes stop_codon:yes gene_type:complete